jgi:hypothetical protein
MRRRPPPLRGRTHPQAASAPKPSHASWLPTPIQSSGKPCFHPENNGRKATPVKKSCPHNLNLEEALSLPLPTVLGFTGPKSSMSSAAACGGRFGAGGGAKTLRTNAHKRTKRTPRNSEHGCQFHGCPTGAIKNGKEIAVPRNRCIDGGFLGGLGDLGEKS